MKAQPTLRAGIAALALFTVAGLIWGCVAEDPSRAVTTATSPSASQVDATADATERDVSRMGGPAERDRVRYLANFFASPSGNFLCFISAAGAGCAGSTWDAGVRPSRKICKGEGGVMGPELWGTTPAAWACGTDPHSLPFLNSGTDDDNLGVAWWDARFGASAPFPPEPSQQLAILPDGKALVAGDFRCSVAKDTVTCRNSRTGEGFRVSRAKVDLKA